MHTVSAVRCFDALCSLVVVVGWVSLHSRPLTVTGGFLELYVEKLNQPASWPIKVEFAEVNNVT